MQSIATLNHFAVTCMDANKLKEAIHVLVQALEITRRQFYHIHHGSPNDVEGGPTLSPSRLSSCNEASPPQDPAELLTTMVATTITNNGIQHRDVDQQPFNCSSSRKYEQPFLVLQEMDCSTTSSWSTTTFLSMIVIFNCALCHDFLASSSTRVSTTRRQVLRYKAISLYEKVVNLYIELSNDSFKEEDSTGFPGTLGAQQDMIVMAAVNNLVQLHHESSAIRNHYVQLMMALFQQVQTTDYGCDQIRSQVNSQGRVFVSNTLLCRAMELTSAIAPAA